MTLNDFKKKINVLALIDGEKEIIIRAPNGLLFEPTVKRIPKDPYDPFTSEIDKWVITYE